MRQPTNLSKLALLVLAGLTMLTAAALSGCGDDGVGISEARADVPRESVSDEARGDMKKLASDNAAFGWDIYSELAKEPGNLFLSPHSISVAMAMLQAGARGQTATEIAAVMRFTLPGERLHPAFNGLTQSLAEPGTAARDKKPFRLSIVNNAWGQTGYKFEKTYLEALARYYGAGVRLTDFTGDSEGARKAINEWVSDETEKRIEDLLPEGSVLPNTRLVLVNAIYFLADWASPFKKDSTSNDAFTLADGTRVEVPAMHQQRSYSYATANGVQAVELPYEGGRLSMVVMVPERMAEFEAAIDTRAPALIATLKPATVNLAMPRFEFKAEFALVDTLKALGIKQVFDSESDLSGIDGTRNLYVSGVFHKAFVKVDEKGTEAAAATGIVVGETSAPVNVIQVKVDRPFVFLIRDMETGAVLFLGRVADPR